MYHLYNLYDLQEEKMAATGVSAKELAERFGKYSNYISKAAREGITLQGRYRISIADDFPERWEAVTGQLKRYPYIIKDLPICPEKGMEMERSSLWTKENA